MKVEEDNLSIHSAGMPRQGWEKQFAIMAENGDDRLLDKYIPAQWDQNELVCVLEIFPDFPYD